MSRFILFFDLAYGLLERHGVLGPGLGFVVNANIVQFFQFLQDFIPFFRRQKHCFALLLFVHDILRMYPNYDAPLQSPTPLFLPPRYLIELLYHIGVGILLSKCHAKFKKEDWAAIMAKGGDIYRPRTIKARYASSCQQGCPFGHIRRLPASRNNP